jgi:hypothetical protein
MSANVTLRTSAIDGIGVFAVHPFQCGDFVLEIDDSRRVDGHVDLEFQRRVRQN